MRTFVLDKSNEKFVTEILKLEDIFLKTICNMLKCNNHEREELGMYCVFIWSAMAIIASIFLSLTLTLLSSSVHAVFICCSRDSHACDCLPPLWLSNQCHCVTCTTCSSQSLDRVMCVTNHHLTCKTVFLRNSPLPYILNY